MSQHLRRTARLVGAVIVAVVTVHVPLPQLSVSLVLLTAAAAAAVAVAVVSWCRRPLLAVLLVVSVILAVAMSVLSGTIMSLHVLAVSESHPSLGIVHGLKVVVVVAVYDVTLWHHLQVGPDTMVACTCVIAKVNHPAFIGTLIRRFDPG